MLLALAAGVAGRPGYPMSPAQLAPLVALWARGVEAMPIAQTAVAVLRRAMRAPAPTSWAATAARSRSSSSCHGSRRHWPLSASG
jgi:hypothetical protein